MSANCPVGDQSCRRIVLSANWSASNRLVGDMSCRGTVLLTSCPVGELPEPWAVLRSTRRRRTVRLQTVRRRTVLWRTARVAQTHTRLAERPNIVWPVAVRTCIQFTSNMHSCASSMYFLLFSLVKRCCLAKVFGRVFGANITCSWEFYETQREALSFLKTILNFQYTFCSKLERLFHVLRHHR